MDKYRIGKQMIFCLLISFTILFVFLLCGTIEAGDTNTYILSNKIKDLESIIVDDEGDGDYLTIQDAIKIIKELKMKGEKESLYKFLNL